MIYLKKGAHVHLMGICGTAMASLAGILKELGYKVTGSDQNVYPPMSTLLEGLGIEIKKGYVKENLEPRPDLVIVGNVIRKDFEEPTELLKTDIPYTSLPKAMSEFVIQDRNSIVLTGTHGKTTMTSMMAHISEAINHGSGFLVGGIPLNFNVSFKAPENDWFVIEGDEYDTAFFDKVPKFVHYKPKYVVISSIEFDNADIYNSIEEIKDSFRRLVSLVPADGVIVANGEDQNVLDVIKKAKAKVVTYGMSKGDYHVGSREILVGRNKIDLVYKDESKAD